jgi:hypothetical protein
MADSLARPRPHGAGALLNSHWCFIVRQKASMSEFEKVTSVCARTRRDKLSITA